MDFSKKRTSMINFIFIVRFFIISLLFGCSTGQENTRVVASETTVSEETTESTSERQPCGGRTVDICITMDRNPEVQKMTVYKNGIATYTFPVSTGRETFDIPTNFNRHADCSSTPLGIFEPTKLQESYNSGTWLVRDPQTGRYTDGAPMGNSIFFQGGYSIHAAGTREAAAALGPKPPGGTGTGSGGCVRLYPWDAKTVFGEIAACDRTEVKNVCVEREVTLAETRTSANGEIREPRCLRTAEQAVCVDYRTQSPACAAGASPQCPDPKKDQATLQQKSFAIEVIDTRSQADIDNMQAKCRRDEEQYNKRKAECVVEKLNLSENVSNTQIEQTLASQTEARRRQINYQCNEQLYNEAQAQRGQIAAPPAGSTSAPARSADNSELPPPRPRTRRFRDTRVGQWLNRVFPGGSAEQN
jgi:hypothetical protein